MSLFFKPSAQTTSVITNGLVSRYTFEGTADTTTLTDVAGTNDGTINGMVYGSDSTGRPTSVTGGNYGSYDGTDDYVDVANDASLQPATFTYCGWVNLNSVNSEFSVYLKESKGPWNKLAVRNNTVRATATASGSTIDVDTGALLTTNTWYHLAMSYDGGTVRVYVDGTEDASDASLGGDAEYSSQTAQIGADGSNYASGTPFDGRIDGVRVYNRALSPSEIADIYNGNG